jgi:hypothetical protein
MKRAEELLRMTSYTFPSEDEDARASGRNKSGKSGKDRSNKSRNSGRLSGRLSRSSSKHTLTSGTELDTADAQQQQVEGTATADGGVDESKDVLAETHRSVESLDSITSPLNFLDQTMDEGVVTTASSPFRELRPSDNANSDDDIMEGTEELKVDGTGAEYKNIDPETYTGRYVAPEDEYLEPFVPRNLADVGDEIIDDEMMSVHSNASAGQKSVHSEHTATSATKQAGSDQQQQPQEQVATSTLDQEAIQQDMMDVASSVFVGIDMESVNNASSLVIGSNFNDPLSVSALSARSVRSAGAMPASNQELQSTPQQELKEAVTSVEPVGETQSPPRRFVEEHIDDFREDGLNQRQSRSHSHSHSGDHTGVGQGQGSSSSGANRHDDGIKIGHKVSSKDPTASRDATAKDASKEASSQSNKQPQRAEDDVQANIDTQIPQQQQSQQPSAHTSRRTSTQNNISSGSKEQTHTSPDDDEDAEDGTYGRRDSAASDAVSEITLSSAFDSVGGSSSNRSSFSEPHDGSSKPANAQAAAGAFVNNTGNEIGIGAIQKTNGVEQRGGSNKLLPPTHPDASTRGKHPAETSGRTVTEPAPNFYRNLGEWNEYCRLCNVDG